MKASREILVPRADVVSDLVLARKYVPPHGTAVVGDKFDSLVCPS